MNGNLKIRLAVVSERGTLEQLQLRASLNNEGDREALLAHPDAIDLPEAQISAGQVFVAEQNAVTVGFAAVLQRSDSDIELDGLFVEPTYWRRGIGHVLVDRCVEYARKHGASALHVIGNPHAKGFYEAYGFEPSGTHQTRFGVGFLLRKTLAGS